MLDAQGLRKSYGPVLALDAVDLTVEKGDLTAVLGPSGCGKTTLLRCVAGFERVDAGTVTLDGRAVAAAGTHVPPHRRHVTVVPQEGALFPHFSVRDNVGYGLDRSARRGGRVDEVLALVGLDGYADRMPHQLSGGQQQRVAVARALAPRPPLVLLDEPFSALDATLRTDLRRDIRAALRADGATAILVTHDQGEALSMADHIAVMRAGRIVQHGQSNQVYEDPADPWIAEFVGEAMLLPATIANATTVDTALGRLPLRGAAGAAGRVRVLLRPEQLSPTDGDLAEVTRHEYHGHDTLLGLRLADGTPLLARVMGQRTPPVGASIGLDVLGAVRAYGDA
ncbi:ABC transporter ATP-binding protein [Asanoa iriomotensis]|uniref:Fe(3+) ions import ATP-binding protein FbpC n=1 Tax=Asanoa iriomotensis TaxID=234613 RepID=A0ABQ4BZ31_9ACTN|nr:ABC transporter ATP-binding protein [Asanoa iriomotensis]GIF55755.1 Fe(3+) ions import ATP-binding protein FbpC [Asanoa iriomotensis]